MILVLAAYFGMAYYLIEKMIQTAKNLEEASNFLLDDSPEYNNNLNIDVDTNNILYKEFMSTINKHELDVNKKILVCCTGDYQSIALLTIASQIFGKENVHVFLHNYDETYKIQHLLMELCCHNDFTFHCIENNDDSRSNRYNRIEQLCRESDISYVFEGHTIINYSNDILSSIFSNKSEETYSIVSYKPFINIDNTTLFKFFSTYDIRIDDEFTHLEHTRLQYKTVFEDVEQTVSNYYPNWRMNVIEHFDKTDFNRELNIVRGKYGFLLSIDLNTISYYSFTKSLNKIFDEYGFNNDDLEDYYNNDDDEMFFISKEYQHNINNFIKFLNKTDLDILVDELLENQSQSSFEDIEQSIKDSSDDNQSNNQSENLCDTEESHFSNDSNDSDEPEYIIRADLTTYMPTLKLVEEITNYSEDYINGIIYINVWKNTYYIYESNTNNISDNNISDDNIDCVCDDKKTQ